MRLVIPFLIVVFATVVYARKRRECCSCEDRTVKNNKWTVTLEEKQDKKPEKGGGDEEEGGGGRGKGRGGDSEEEGGKRRRGKGRGGKGRRRGSEEEGGKGGRKRKGSGEEEEEEGGKGEEVVQPENGYDYVEGIVKGDEPNDFKGKFTKEMRTLQKQVLKRHNKWRKLHGVRSLKHSEELCRYAQAYAYRLAKKGRMKHRTRGNYGENLFMSMSVRKDHHVHGNIVVDAWYDEIKMHKWKEFQHETGHFTQVIWKGSKYVGSGIAKLGRKIFVVSNYDPPGNVLGTFAENVLKPQEDDDD